MLLSLVKYLLRNKNFHKKNKYSKIIDIKKIDYIIYLSDSYYGKSYVR